MNDSLDWNDSTASDNCTNDYCISDDDYWELILSHIMPKHYEWLLITLHGIVFFVGLVGNALVCLAVYRNAGMRTVTNFFIVNLAAADFLVILVCLPPTVIWDVTETWFLGTTLCKLILYLQTVSVTVSVLTLTFISVDRWYAICFPLKFKSTTSRAVTAIIVIWIIALVLDIPELITLTSFKRMDLRIDTILFTQCEASWGQSVEQTFSAMKIGLLYALPLLFMTVAYFQIVKVLWSSDNIPGQLTGSGSSRRGGRFANASAEGQLRSRRKAARMLVAVVIMFAASYLPVHLLSILRYTVNIPQNDLTAAISMLSHWLCYANSAVNPLIYNFMSGKFRKEFRRSFGPCFPSRPQRSCRLSVIAPKTETIPLSSTLFKVD